MSDFAFYYILFVVFFFSLITCQIFLVGSGLCEKGSLNLWISIIFLLILTAMGWGWMCFMYAVTARLTYPYMEWSDFGLGLYLCFSWIFSLIVCCCIWWQNNSGNPPN